MIAAPTYPMLRDATFRTFRDMARRLNRPYRLNKTDGIVTLGNGADVLLRTTSDPDRMRGPNLSGIWLDEASVMIEEAYDIALPSLREAGEQGWLDLTFTPKGKAHWTYKRLAQAADLATDLVHSHTKDNPFNPRDYAATIERQYGSGLFAKQELGGEFLDLGDTEWPSEYFERPDFFYDAVQGEIVLRVLFYDGAGGKESRLGDWHAAVILTVTADGHLWADVRLWKGSQDKAADTLIEICQEPGRLDACGVESNFGGDVMIPLLGYTAKKYGRPDLVGKWFGVPHRLNKQQRIRRLGPHLASGTLHVRRGVSGTEALRQFEQFPLPAAHDDALDALDGARELAESLLAA